MAPTTFEGPSALSVISDDTRAQVDLAEPDFSTETAFPGPTAADPPPKNKGGRPRGSTKSHKRKPGNPYSGPRPRPGRESAAEKSAGAPAPVVVEETPKALINGCRWMLRNVVVIMETAYGWDRPEDYDEWLIEASTLGAKCVQKHFPDWMDQFADEILLLAILGVWAVPNVSRQLARKKPGIGKKPDSGNAGTEGQRQDHTVVSPPQFAHLWESGRSSGPNGVY